MHDDPPAAWFLVDYFALLRGVGTPETMASQMRYLTAVARLPHVTIQVVPGTAHAGMLGGFTVTDKENVRDPGYRLRHGSRTVGTAAGAPGTSPMLRICAIGTKPNISAQ